MCNTCVIMFLQQRSICLSIRDSKMEGVPGRATLSGHLPVPLNGGSTVLLAGQCSHTWPYILRL